MKLVKKLKFFHLLSLSKIDREKVFADVVGTKKAFKDYENICLNVNLVPRASVTFVQRMGQRTLHSRPQSHSA